ncbi:MAG TPA: hypothetical protein VG603_15975 [Chitinophagales bacterium]|nr:hypothetical protein [Chitinophagales bacterium]
MHVTFIADDILEVLNQDENKDKQVVINQASLSPVIDPDDLHQAARLLHAEGIIQLDQSEGLPENRVMRVKLTTHGRHVVEVYRSYTRMKHFEFIRSADRSNDEKFKKQIINAFYVFIALCTLACIEIGIYVVFPFIGRMLKLGH